MLSLNTCVGDMMFWQRDPTFTFLIGDTVSVMRGSRKFCQRGSNYDFFLSLTGGGRINVSLLASHHRPASETPFKWRFAGVPMMAQH